MPKLKTFKPSWIPDRLPPRARPQPARKAGGAPGLPPNFYQSAAWLSARAVKVTSHPLCEPCLRRGATRVVEVVHHKEPVEARPDLALDQSNLESSCKSCHNRAHPEKGRRKKAAPAGGSPL